MSRHMLSYMPKTTHIFCSTLLFLCDSFTCGAYGILCYGNHECNVIAAVAVCVCCAAPAGHYSTSAAIVSVVSAVVVVSSLVTSLPCRCYCCFCCPCCCSCVLLLVLLLLLVLAWLLLVLLLLPLLLPLPLLLLLLHSRYQSSAAAAFVTAMVSILSGSLLSVSPNACCCGLPTRLFDPFRRQAYKWLASRLFHPFGGLQKLDGGH